MHIRKRTLAKLPRGYSIATVPGTETGGLPSFLAGSEGDDNLLYFEAPDFKPRLIAREPGGFISLAPLEHGGRRHVVAATKFKPGFDAASSDIRVYPLDRGEMPAPIIIADLPYTHRVAVLAHNGKKFLLASTLCAAKANKEDWTQPGGIWLAEIPGESGGLSISNTPRRPMLPVFPGLNKNHGMDFARLGGRAGYLVSAMEGLAFLPVPADPAAAPWRGEWINRSECSDAFAFDWDGDGDEEIFSISPFHGNELAIHKRIAGAAHARGDEREWRRTLIHDDLSFGHIVWAGNFLGAPGLLAGSRRERRELRLYRPAADGSVNPDCELIDEGIGPSQINVVECSPARMALYVAAHGLDEVRIYEIEK